MIFDRKNLPKTRAFRHKSIASSIVRFNRGFRLKFLSRSPARRDRLWFFHERMYNFFNIVKTLTLQFFSFTCIWFFFVKPFGKQSHCMNGPICTVGVRNIAYTWISMGFYFHSHDIFRSYDIFKFIKLQLYSCVQ